MSFAIAGRKIGPGYPPYIIAEISCNHAYARAGSWGPAGQSLERCKALVRAAAEAGCDAVKLQTYKPDTITMKCSKPPFQVSGAKVDLWNGQTLYELYEKNYTPWEWTKPLMELANSLGLHLFTSPFDETAVDFLEQCNVPAYKIASFESTDHGLLRKVAATGKPIIFSTGMSTSEDIDETFKVLRAAGAKHIAVLKCTSAYPAQPKDAHVSAIPFLAKNYNVVSGLSDHTVGNQVALTAIAVGAAIIEKHIILGEGHPTADGPFSSTPSQFKELCENAKIVYSCLGNPKLAFAKKEGEAFCSKHRRSIFVVKDMRKGDIFLKGENVKSIRPAQGLHTRYWSDVIGKYAKEDIEAGTPLSFDLISSLDPTSENEKGNSDLEERIQGKTKETVISADGITVQRLRKCNIELLRLFRNNQMDVLRQSKELSKEDQEKWWEETVLPNMQEEQPDFILYEIIENNRFIGYGGFVHIDWTKRVAEISFLIDPMIAKSKDSYNRIHESFLNVLKVIAFRSECWFSKLWAETYNLPHRQEHINNMIKSGFCEYRRDEKSIWHSIESLNECVLVTGGSGCIGRDLIRSIDALGAKIICVDLQRKPAWMPPSVVYMHMDANRLTADMLRRYNIKIIFHLAATFERSEETTAFWDSSFWHNVQLSHQVANIAKELKSVKRIIFASSYLIYDEKIYSRNGVPQEPSYLGHDTSSIQPRNICGMAKLMHEVELDFVRHIRPDISSVSARIFRLYGKGDRCIISRWVRAGLNGKSLNVYGGESIFDYILDKDAAEGLLRLARSSYSGVCSLGSGVPHTVNEVADIISAKLRVNLTVSEVPENYTYEASVANISQLQTVTNWRPPTSLEDGIQALIDYEMQNPKGHSWEPWKEQNVLISSAGRKVELCEIAKVAISEVGEGQVIAADAAEYDLTTYYSDKYWQMPLLEGIEVQVVQDYLENHNVAIVIPTRDGELKWWSEHKSLFKTPVMVSDAEVIEKCLDKVAFYKDCKAWGIPCIPTVENIDNISGASTYVVRERYGNGSKGLVVNVGKEEAIEAGNRMSMPVFSPFVLGEEYTIDFYVNQQGELVEAVPRLRTLVINGESWVSTTRYDATMINLVKNLVAHLHIRGHANLQLFKTPSSIEIIELNPRVGGASALSINAGCKSINWFLQEAKGVYIEPRIGNFQRGLTRICSKRPVYSDRMPQKMPPVYTYAE